MDCLSPAGLACVLVLVVWIAGGLGWKSVVAETRNNLANQLQTTLMTNVEALKIWMDEKKLDVRVLSQQPQIHNNLLSIIRFSNSRPTVTPDDLRGTPELGILRRDLGEACIQYGFIGFVAFDMTGLQVATLLEEPLGRRQLIENSDFFYRVLQGETIVTHPFRAEVNLPDLKGVYRPTNATMFAATPIRDEQGEIVGVLSLRMRPEKSYTRLLEISQSGLTGESFIFNSDGIMLSDSRFNDQLRRWGLLPNGIEGRATLNLPLRVFDLSSPSFQKPSEGEPLPPLTHLASEAIRKRNGVHVEGYPGYRGIDVVGAWMWLDDYQFGIGHEIEMKEAYGPLNILYKTYFFLFCFLCLVSVLALLIQARQYYLKKNKQMAEEALRRSEERLGLVLYASTDGFYDWNLETGEVFFSRQWIESLGYSPDEIKPTFDTWKALIHPEDYLDWLSIHSNRGKRSPNFKFEYRLLHKDGTWRWTQSRGEVIEVDEDGRPIRRVGTDIDITDRKEAEKEKEESFFKLQSVLSNLDLVNKQLKQSNRELEEFAFIASHDLQEPLRKIRMFNEFVDQCATNMDKNARRYLTKSSQAAVHMQVLVQSLLEYSRVTSSSNIYQWTDLNEVLRNVLTDLESMIEETEGTISLGAVPCLEGDPSQLYQLFLQLISNGLKFHRQGIPPRVNISSKKLRRGQWEIYVNDNGIGFDPKYAMRIFRPFERLMAHGPLKGSGIGLAICRKIVDQHGGRIISYSQPEKGSQFTICLPERHPMNASNQ